MADADERTTETGSQTPSETETELKPTTGAKINKPWLVAVWPGMGHVAVNAGYYLMAKLNMAQVAELPARELFDVEHVEVKQGIVHPGRLPRSRFFRWIDPAGHRDLLLFIGEAQPPIGKYNFCVRLIAYAKQLGVERVFTFAAMATQMHPGNDARVFAAATTPEVLAELRALDVQILDDGQIGGLNGLLIGAAAESGLPGACLLGEMPHVFAQLPFPKASREVLKNFANLSGIQIDLAELDAQAGEMERGLTQLLEQMKEAIKRQRTGDEDEDSESESDDESESFDLTPAPEPEGPDPAELGRLEELFDKAANDRAYAYELKRKLDELGLYRQYEDRFLDLFKKPE